MYLCNPRNFTVEFGYQYDPFEQLSTLIQVQDQIHLQAVHSHPLN